jgi:prepilin-type N-terminal cleavage/methylation domain-containing protein
MFHKRSSCEGFTLIELLVAVAVMAILAVLAAPAMGSYFAGARLKSAADELFNDMQFARLESVQRNAAVTVTFSSSGYTITSGPSTLKTVTFRDGTSVVGGAALVANFDPIRATASLPSGSDVTLTNGAISGTLRISLNTMGRATICAPSGSVKGYSTC